MASKGYVEAQINRLDAKIRNVFSQVFTHVLDTYQIGGISHQEKALNFKWVRLDSTTASNAGEEFTIPHGAGQMPLYLIPFMPLDSSGVWMPRLVVTRPADASRIYLSSPDTNVQFSVLMEI